MELLKAKIKEMRATEKDDVDKQEDEDENINVYYYFDDEPPKNDPTK